MNEFWISSTPTKWVLRAYDKAGQGVIYSVESSTRKTYRLVIQLNGKTTLTPKRYTDVDTLTKEAIALAKVMGLDFSYIKEFLE